jgi:hypothetical protein
MASRYTSNSEVVCQHVAEQTVLPAPTTLVKELSNVVPEPKKEQSGSIKATENEQRPPMLLPVPLIFDIDSLTAAQQQPIIQFGNNVQVGTINVYHGLNTDLCKQPICSKQQDINKRATSSKAEQSDKELEPKKHMIRFMLKD